MDLNISALQTAPEKALFSIPDNGLLCLFYGNGDRHFAVCLRG